MEAEAKQGKWIHSRLGKERSADTQTPSSSSRALSLSPPTIRATSASALRSSCPLRGTAGAEAEVSQGQARPFGSILQTILRVTCHLPAQPALSKAGTTNQGWSRGAAGTGSRGPPSSESGQVASSWPLWEHGPVQSPWSPQGGRLKLSESSLTARNTFPKFLLPALAQWE